MQAEVGAKRTKTSLGWMNEKTLKKHHYVFKIATQVYTFYIHEAKRNLKWRMVLKGLVLEQYLRANIEFSQEYVEVEREARMRVPNRRAQ